MVLKTISRPPPPQPPSLLIGTRATLEPHGGVAEWFKAVVLKTTVPSQVPGVRIPPPPPLEPPARGSHRAPAGRDMTPALPAAISPPPPLEGQYSRRPSSG